MPYIVILDPICIVCDALAV